MSKNSPIDIANWNSIIVLLREAAGKTLKTLFRAAWMESPQDHGPLQLVWSDGCILTFELGSDGQSIVITNHPIPFDLDNKGWIKIELDETNLIRNHRLKSVELYCDQVMMTNGQTHQWIQGIILDFDDDQLLAYYNELDDSKIVIGNMKPDALSDLECISIT